MRHYSFIKAVPLSFYSEALYSDVRKEWKGLGFSYLLFVLFLVCLIGAVFCSVASLYLDDKHPIDIDAFLKQVPTLTFKNGELSSQAPQPVYIRLQEDNNKVIGVIDTTHDVNQWSNSNEVLFVLGKTQMLQRKKQGEVTIQDYSKNLNQTMTYDQLEQWKNVLMSWRWVVPFIAIPFVMLPFFLYRIVQALLYGLCGLLIAKIMRVPLSYTDSVRLVSVSITPVIVLGAVLLLTPIILPWYVYFGLAMAYLVFAISAEHV